MRAGRSHADPSSSPSTPVSIEAASSIRLAALAARRASIRAANWRFCAFTFGERAARAAAASAVRRSCDRRERQADDEATRADVSTEMAVGMDTGVRVNHALRRGSR
jgi:hypothetical protein